jgi:hypothetical protein
MYRTKTKKNTKTQSRKLKRGGMFTDPTKNSILITKQYHCRVPDKEWSFQDGGLYIIKKVGVKILTIIVLYRLS